MLTTVEVRAIMREHIEVNCIYTNKTRKNCGAERRVKCYLPAGSGGARAKLIAALRSAAGAENVRVTRGLWHMQGVTVRCMLAE